MRSKRQKIEHQGALKVKDKIFAAMMQGHPETYYTTLDICRITGCASARDKIRKLQSAGIKIGPAKLLWVNDNGSRVFGWRMR